MATEKEYEALIDDYITQGYALLDRGESSALLRKSTCGSGTVHLLILLLGGVCLAGFVNLIYALAAHYGADKVLVRLADRGGGE